MLISQKINLREDFLIDGNVLKEFCNEDTFQAFQ